MTSHDTSEARPGDLWSLPMLQDHCARPLVTTPLPSTLRGSHNPLATGPSLPCSQCSSHQGVSGRAAGPSPHGVQMWRVLPNPGLRGGSPQDGRATGQNIIPSPSKAPQQPGLPRERTPLAHGSHYYNAPRMGTAQTVP